MFEPSYLPDLRTADFARRVVDILRRNDRPLSDGEARAALGLLVHIARTVGYLSSDEAPVQETGK